MAGGVVRASRGGCAVDLKDENGTAAIAGPAGIARGSEIGALVDGGFQKFSRRPPAGKSPRWQMS